MGRSTGRTRKRWPVAPQADLRSKLLLSSAFPLIAILVLAGFGFATFQTVKVNGPQYGKIAAAKDLEADILPPPGYLVETHLLAALLPRSDGRAEFNATVAKLTSLEGEFEARHKYWQEHLTDTDPMRVAMRSAFVDGRSYFGVLRNQYLPAAQAAMVARTKAAGDTQSPSVLAAQRTADEIFASKLTPLYQSHRSSIDTTVRLSTTRQTAVESSTRSLVDGRLQLLGLTALGVLLASGLLAVFSARSISRPISTLTRTAIDTAERQLPAAVAKIQSGEESGALHSTSGSEFAEDQTEIGALARALDSMRNTAIDLAADQALIRRNVSDNLVNVARRNQLLLKRTLGSISSMENEERDPAKLERLFQLDHLTTRMRRNAESLLVLAGSEGPKLWTTPMVIGDVVRSALSQIEAYNQVDFGHLDPAFVRGQAVTDISHLLAEFLENATYYSPPNARVNVTGRQRQDGYVLVVSDDGVGMTPEAIEQANARLLSPASFDTEPTKVLGHTVAGHLANRYGITVLVRESLTKGIAVQIFLPNSVLQDSAGPETPESAGPIATVSSAVAALRSDPVLSSAMTAASGASSMASGSSSSVSTGAAASAVSGASARTGGSADPDGVTFEVPAVLPKPMPTGTGGGLTKRVRGANLPDTGPETAVAPRREASDVRSALSSLQRGIRAAEAGIELEPAAAGHHAPTGPAGPPADATTTHHGDPR